MAPIRFQATKKSMSGQILDVPVFPGDIFPVGIPEAIGSTSLAAWFPHLKPDWTELDHGEWKSTGAWPDLLSYTVSVRPAEDYIDFEIELKNDSNAAWNQTLAFNCIKVGDSASLKDHECARHWTRTGSAFKRLIELPRGFSARPTIQFYAVEGGPPASQIPFVDQPNVSTPGLELEGWLAVQSRDGGRLAAVVSKPALFLFQNMEYSCVHCAPTFGALAPGESRKALTRVYFVEMSLPAWHERMQREMGFVQNSVRHGFNSRGYSSSDGAPPPTSLTV